MNHWTLEIRGAGQGPRRNAAFPGKRRPDDRDC